MAVHVDQRREETVISLAGELDVHCVSRVRDAVLEAIRLGSGRVVFEMSDLEFADSTGITMMIVSYRQLEAQGRSFLIRLPSKPVRKLLHVTNLDRLFEIEEPATS